MSVLDNPFGLMPLQLSALMAATGASLVAGNEGSANNNGAPNRAESFQVQILSVKQLTIMKMTTRNTRGRGAWILGGVASLLMCVSALGQYTTTQSAPTTINDASTASPYPSSIDLTTSNILGVVETVNVTVNNLSHPYAPDIGMLLVGPNGHAVVLMSGSGGNPSGSAALNGANLTFTDKIGRAHV